MAEKTENLTPFTSDNAKEMQLKGAKKRKENTAKKKLISQIYADFLAKKYSVKVGGENKKITGADLCNEAMKKIMARGDSSSVSLMKEIREAMEGNTINLSGKVETAMKSTEERLKEFEALIH